MKIEKSVGGKTRRQQGLGACVAPTGAFKNEVRVMAPGHERWNFYCLCMTMMPGIGGRFKKPDAGKGARPKEDRALEKY